jgi:Zn/Cd-binding protein ZinT
VFIYFCLKIISLKNKNRGDHMNNKKMFSVLTISVLFLLVITGGVLAAGSQESEQDVINDLLPWKGSNESYINLFNTESGEQFFEAIAKEASGYDSEMVANYYSKKYKTNFSKLEVNDAKTVIIDGQIEAEYDYVGNANIPWGEYNLSWYIFRTKNEAAIKAGLKNLVLMTYHGEGMKHCHLRYGNQNFDYLTTDPSISNWWPTMFKTNDVDKEKVVKGMIKQAKLYASKLPDLSQK